ncbi:DUF3800 domain-containing protein (plasmid) [Fructilactobacillus ixorae]|uniref:DUF3800 domain-containing protein n=1 Tax=Fructilactobacillus ixorae TaxID=1750535 RepID=A0ABY5C6L1_9LACO|nr:DUF3800 domain-containing protein [Fructilactobacillus ixorae]USS94022.1 DUF3800 domain-containing protein [Fructilactobacillus ixorae]
MQQLYFYFDDAGVLTNKSWQKYFLYAGYCFQDNNEISDYVRKYINVLSSLKKSLNVSGELKASRLGKIEFGGASGIPREIAENVYPFKYRNKLFNVFKKADSCSIITEISCVNNKIINDKLSTHRFKDFLLKILVKRKIEALIKEGKIDPNLFTKISVFLDEQAVSTNGVYNLEGSIKEELFVGMNNSTGKFFKPIFNQNGDVKVNFKQSDQSPMIQACDILANRIYNGENKPDKCGKYKLLEIPNHQWVKWPLY